MKQRGRPSGWELCLGRGRATPHLHLACAPRMCQAVSGVRFGEALGPSRRSCR